MSKLCRTSCRYYHIDYCEKRPTKPELGLSCNLYKRRYERWKPTIDYAIRNLNVMDEEETRLIESNEAMNNFLNGFAKERVPKHICETIKFILRKQRYFYKHGGDWKVQYALYHAVLVLLEPFMSHAALYNTDYDAWEKAFWQAMSR